MIYECRYQVAPSGEVNSVRLESVDGPSVTVTVDNDMLEALKAMKYRSLHTIDKSFVIRHQARPIDFEAFVAKINPFIFKKILASLNHCHPVSIKLKMIEVSTGKPDFNVLARMLAGNREYLEKEAELLS